MLGLEPDAVAGLKVVPIPGAIEDDLLLAGVRLVDRRFNVRIDDGIVTVRELIERPTGGLHDTREMPIISPMVAKRIAEEPPRHQGRRSPMSVARQLLEQRRRH